MSEYTRPRNKKEFEENFEQIKPLMNDTEAHYESSRCLFCFDAPCVTACPTGIDIPLFIRQINAGNADGAATTIYESNFFGHACGKVCPTEVLCEGACVYNNQKVKPIEIGRLQAHATHQAMEKGLRIKSQDVKPNGKKAAIIGAGPAGIACACELRELGFEVHIYEAKEKPSGLTVHGVAPYKITNEEVLKEMAYLQEQFGYEVYYNRPVSNAEDIARLESDYDAIFIGIGLGKTSTLAMKGEDLDNCLGAVEFIEDLRKQQHQTKVGQKVIVLGGGNTAMDAASESARMGAEEVILAYRRSKDEMGAYDFEYDLAKEVGVRGLFNVSPVEIVGEGKVKGVKFVHTHYRINRLEPVPGSTFIEECDMVIMATGQEKQRAVLSLISGLELDEKGRIKVNADTFQTTNPKYFAGGDAVNGGAEVVNAAAHGKVAAWGIKEWLGVA